MKYLDRWKRFSSDKLRDTTVYGLKPTPFFVHIPFSWIQSGRFNSDQVKPRVFYLIYILFIDYANKYFTYDVKNYDFTSGI